MEEFVSRNSIVGVGSYLFHCLPSQEEHSELLKSWQRKRSTMGLCCLKIAMYFFLFFNHLCFILGTLIFGCGIWVLSNKNPFGIVVQITAPSLEVGIYAFTAIGAITMFMGFLGCMGAFYGIQWLLCLYIFFLTLILMAQVAIAAFVSSQMDMVTERSTQTILDLMKNYNPDNKNNQTLENTWDYVQSQFNCCGLNGPEDWKDNAILKKKHNISYPCSCSNTTRGLKGFCSLKMPHLTARSIDKWPVVQRGCKEAVQHWINKNFNIILGMSIAVALVEIFGMVLSLCFFNSRKHTRGPRRF